MTGKIDNINFGKESFNYFKPNEELMKFYDNSEKVFKIEGYKYSLPIVAVIGIRLLEARAVILLVSGGGGGPFPIFSKPE